MADEPIEVNANAVPDQLWSALRSLIVALTAFAVGRGWLAEDTVTTLLAVGGILGPFVIGQLVSRRRALALASLADSAPNDIATLRGTIRKV